MAVKTKIRALKRARRDEQQAREFARMIEEQAVTDDWTRVLYNVDPAIVGMQERLSAALSHARRRTG
jgi:hypothetical protein